MLPSRADRLGRAVSEVAGPGVQLGAQQVHCSGYSFELHRTDVTKHEPIASTDVGCHLADQHFTGPREVRDARTQVHGLTEVIALLEEDRSRMQADDLS